MVESRTISQVPALAAVSPNARMLVSEPGGLEGTVDLKTLFGKYIATDTATATVADLNAQLGYDDKSIGLVFSDPELLKNGWYRKTGAKGAGRWVQFETLSKATRESMLPLSGNGPPAAALGLEGQFYRDLQNSDEYGPKTAAGWGAPRSLRGAPGAASSTYTSLEAMSAADVANRSYNLAPVNGADDGVEAGLFLYQEGDFRGRPDVIEKGDVPLSQGGLVPPSADAFWLRPSGAGAVPIKVGQMLLNWRLVESYGAKGDGLTDDTAAFERAYAALPPGAELNVTRGKRYVVSRSLVPTVPIRMIGGSRESCEIFFKANGNYLAIGGGGRACMLLLHPNTSNIVGYDGKVLRANAVRTEMDGITFIAEGGMPVGTHGVLVTAPVYVTSCDFKGFSGDGLLIQSGADQITTGNANGSTFTNCIAQYNRGSGFALRGNDANACFFLGCRSPSNGAWGFFDDSLLGNVYVQCEADNNTSGGYFATNEKPCRSLYLGCYSETPTHFQLGSRCILLAPQGLGHPDAIVGAVAMSGLPSGDAYCNSPLVGAAREVVANVMGGAIDPGQAYRLSWQNGFEWRMQPGQGLTGLTAQDGENYATLAVNGVRVALLPVRDVTANITRGRMWNPKGLTVGDAGKTAVAGSGLAPPTDGVFDVGAQWWNEAPTVGGYVGWVCVQGGAPGVWRPYGKIEEVQNA